jgi:hypothetical protein
MRDTHDDGSMHEIHDGAEIFGVPDVASDELESGGMLDAGGSPSRPRRAAMAIAVAVVAVGALFMAHRSGPARTGLSTAAGSLQLGSRQAGPSAAQLADGRWQLTAFPPIRFTYPSTVWNGSALIAFDGRDGLPAQAAAYHPLANRWTTIASPPAAVGANPVGAWGDHQLLLIARETGFATSWRPKADRWTPIRPLPVSGIVSLVWAGGHAVAITTATRATAHRGIARRQALARAFVLRRRHWIRLPDLPRPDRTAVRDAAAAVENGVVYVVATGAQVDQRRPATGSTELLRLDLGRWTRVPVTTRLPASDLSIASLTGALLVTGSACPEQRPCLYRDVAALVRLGATARVTVLKPPFGTPYPGNVTGGGRAVVGAARDRSYWVYDITTSRWRQGPTAPALVAPAGVYWTPDGTLTGGAFLRPR